MDQRPTNRPTSSPAAIKQIKVLQQSSPSYVTVRYHSFSTSHKNKIFADIYHNSLGMGKLGRQRALIIYPFTVVSWIRVCITACTRVKQQFLVEVFLGTWVAPPSHRDVMVVGVQAAFENFPV